VDHEDFGEQAVLKHDYQLGKDFSVIDIQAMNSALHQAPALTFP
jgi:hypothetical protein